LNIKYINYVKKNKVDPAGAQAENSAVMTGSEIISHAFSYLTRTPRPLTSDHISHAFSYLTRTPRPLTSDHINMSAGGITRVVVAFGFKNFLQQDGKRTALCKTCNVKIDSQMTTSNFVRHLKSHILPS